MKLSEFIDGFPGGAKGFAVAIGVCDPTVYRYMHGHRLPKPEIMRRIHDITGGAVRPTDFYDITGGAVRPTDFYDTSSSPPFSVPEGTAGVSPNNDEV